MKLSTILSFAALASASRLPSKKRAAPAIPQPNPGESPGDFLDRLIDQDDKDRDAKHATARKRSRISTPKRNNDVIPTEEDYSLHKRVDPGSEIISIYRDVYQQNFTVEGEVISVNVDLNSRTGCKGFKFSDTIGPYIPSTHTGYAEPEDTKLFNILSDLHEIYYNRADGDDDPFAKYTTINFNAAIDKADEFDQKLAECPIKPNSLNGLAAARQLRQLLCYGCTRVTFVHFLTGGAVGAAAFGALGMLMDAIFEDDHRLVVKNDVEMALGGAIGGIAGIFVSKLKDRGTIDAAARVVENPSNAARVATDAVVASAVAVTVASQPRNVQARLRARVALIQNVFAAYMIRVMNGLIRGDAPQQPCIEMTTMTGFQSALNQAGVSNIPGISPAPTVQQILRGDQQC